MTELPDAAEPVLLTAADVRTMELPTTRRGDIRPEAVEKLREQVCETLAALYQRLNDSETAHQQATVDTAAQIRELTEAVTASDRQRDAAQQDRAKLESELEQARLAASTAAKETAELRDSLQQTTAKLIELREELDEAKSRSVSAEAVEVLAMAQKTAGEMLAKAQDDIDAKQAEAAQELATLEEMRRQAVADAEAVAEQLAAADAASRQAMRDVAAKLLAVANGNPEEELAAGALDFTAEDDPVTALTHDELNGELIYSDSAPGRTW